MLGEIDKGNETVEKGITCKRLSCKSMKGAVCLEDRNDGVKNM